MADKPLNVNSNARRIAAQQAAQAHLTVSFESEARTLTAGELINVEGVSFVMAYGGGAVSVANAPGDTPAALADSAGAVVVAGAKLIDVRGARYMSLASGGVVVFTG